MNPQETKTLQEAREMLEEARQIILRGQDKNFVIEQISKAILGGLAPVFEEVNKTISQYISALKEIKVEVPNINVPEANVKVEIPKIEIPEIKFSTEAIEMAIKKAFTGIVLKTPNVEVKAPIVNIPDKMEVKGIAGHFKSLLEGFKGLFRVSIEGIGRDTPLVVTLVDKKGNYYNAMGGPAGVVMAGGKGGGAPAISSSIGDSTKTITTAGVKVQLSSDSVPCRRIFIQAHESNTGTIVVGGSNVVATLIGRRGLALFPTQGDWFNISNLNLIYLDATESGDKINYFYES